MFALVYVSHYTNADGSTVSGFLPGYEPISWGVEYIGKNWALAHLPQDMDFYFFPRFKWDAYEHYVVGLTGAADAPFSIGPAR